ncbi:peritrophin-1-like [Ochlerotatus camptorhynchus]|uniref:peritrophin-1-like n=1 Tax=Ochlerotatus camptorhynchus TaxID=644619 RepID=UPI0031D8E580
MKAKIIISVLFLWEAHVSSATHPTCPPQNGPGEAIHLQHPADCAKFVTCDWGVEVVRDCAPGTLWNDAVKTCDHTRNVKCNTETTIMPTSPTRSFRTRPPIVRTTVTSTTTPTTHQLTNGGCPSVVDRNNPVFLPHLDCTRFYVCTLKGPVEFRCNEGFHWSIKTNHCERPWQAWCVTSATPPTMNDGCPSVVDPNNLVFLSHPDRTKIYICIPGIGRTELSCPEGLHWSTDGCISWADSNMSAATPGTAAITAMITSTASTHAGDYFTTDSYSYV